MNVQAGHAQRQRIWSLPTKHEAGNEGAQESAVSAQFVAACVSYTPPSPEDLAPLRDDIYGWLRRRDRAFVRQLYQFQIATGQERMGITSVIARHPNKQETGAKTEPIQKVKAR
jgi:hypothetical protein